MSFRFRRSVGLGGGMRLNFTKRGISTSFGRRGLRYTIGTTGRRTRTVGIPGTGMSWTESKGGRRRTPTPTGCATLLLGMLGAVLAAVLATSR